MSEQNGRVVYGQHGATYTLGEGIGAGGEAQVYRIVGTNQVAKIYKDPKPGPETEQKIRYMVSNRISDLRDASGQPLLTLAWPQDILSDANGAFVGYTMPFIGNGVEICAIAQGCILPKAKKLFPNYNWLFNLRVAINLARSVAYLHEHNCVIGDLNCKNIMVSPDGSITMLDNDSFDMKDRCSGTHYRCSVGTPDYLAPELQVRDLRQPSAVFSTFSDDFALAIHIFQLLMNNFHPFTGKNMVVIQNSTSINHRLEHLLYGKCPFIHNYSDLTIPVGAPYLDEMVSQQLKRDFIQTFDYNERNIEQRKHQRVTAAKWAEDLEKYWAQFCVPGAAFQCKRNSQHFYLAAMGKCGLCSAEQRLENFRTNMARQKPIQPPASAGQQFKPVVPPSTATSTAAQNTAASSYAPKKKKWWLVAAAALILIVIVAKLSGGTSASGTSSPTTRTTSATESRESDSNYLGVIRGTWEDTVIAGEDVGMLHLNTPIRGLQGAVFNLDATWLEGSRCSEWRCYAWIDDQWEDMGAIYLDNGEGKGTKKVLGTGSEWIEYIAVWPTVDVDEWHYEWTLHLTDVEESKQASQGTKPDASKLSEQNDEDRADDGYLGDIGGTWEETNIEGDNTSMLHLSTPIRGMKQMTFNLDVDMLHGTSCKEWKCFAWVGGEWKKMGTLYLPGGKGYGSATFYGNGTEWIEYIAIRPEVRGNYSFEYYLYLTDVYEKG